MPRWLYTIKVKHLMTEAEDYETVQAEMNQIADILDNTPHFGNFDTSLFREIPEGDGFFSSCDYANELLNRMYDHADANRIWIE